MSMIAPTSPSGEIEIIGNEIDVRHMEQHRIRWRDVWRGQHIFTSLEAYLVSAAICLGIVGVGTYFAAPLILEMT